MLGVHARCNHALVYLHGIGRVGRRGEVGQRLLVVPDELLALGVRRDLQRRLDERLYHLVKRKHRVALLRKHEAHRLFVCALLEIAVKQARYELEQHRIVLPRVQAHHGLVCARQLGAARRGTRVRQLGRDGAHEPGGAIGRVHEAELASERVDLGPRVVRARRHCGRGLLEAQQPHVDQLQQPQEHVQRRVSKQIDADVRRRSAGGCGGGARHIHMPRHWRLVWRGARLGVFFRRARVLIVLVAAARQRRKYVGRHAKQTR